jgi:integrase
MRQFNLYMRGDTFYVRFKDESTGKYSSGISTGEKSRQAAMATIYGWERDGVPSRGGRTIDSISATRRLIDKLRTAELDIKEVRSILDILSDRGFVASATLSGTPAARTLIDFLREFWDYDRSPYVKEKLAHRQRIGRKHCYTMRREVEKWWLPFFGNQLLGDVSRDQIRAFSLSLSDADIMDGTRLHIMNAGTKALRWATHNGLIGNDPSQGIARYAGPGRRRGILTDEEVRRLFSVEWKDSRARLASLLAMTTGMRAGEIAALRLEDIGDDRIAVRHSWGCKDGLKTPKNGETRSVPLLPTVREALHKQAQSSPWWNGPNGFVFWSTVREDIPVDPSSFNTGLYDALVLFDVTTEELEAYHRVRRMKSNKKEPAANDLPAYEKVTKSRKEWQDRRVSFHSWRHSYTTALARIVDRRTMLVTGHKSIDVFETYADHATAEQFAEVREATIQAFGNAIDFPGVASTTQYEEFAV